MATFYKEIIIDFDYTLFDAKRFKQGLANSLVKLGVKNDLFFKYYPLAVRRHNGEYNYNIPLHIKLLKKVLPNLSVNKAQNSLDEVIRSSSQYIYPEAIDFLQKLKASGFYLILVTHGNKNLQTRKIYHSGTAKYFHNIIISPQIKYITLKKLADKFDEVFFISDHTEELKQIEKHLPQLLPIMKISGHTTRFDADRLQLPAFRSLSAIEKFIKKYYKNNHK